jgi:hypothetical protein
LSGWLRLPCWFQKFFQTELDKAMIEANYSRGGARIGAGRKSKFTYFDDWEAARLCEEIEQRELAKWALGKCYKPQKIMEIEQAQKSLREVPISVRQSHLQSSRQTVEEKIDDVQFAYEQLPRIIPIIRTAGRRPRGILTREEIISKVANIIEEKWGCPVSTSSVRKAWKMTRSLWKRLDDNPDV